MDLTSSAVIKGLLEKYNAKPFKGLGQNFLINKGVLEGIIEAAGLEKSDVVLEIGSGVGTLTQALAKKAKRIIAIEKDRNLARILNDELRIMKIKNVEIIENDILKLLNSGFLTHDSYKVVANLPYNITSPVIRKFLESENPPKEMILMVQKEVAQRICAKPPEMNILAVSIQFYSRPEILFYVSKNNFWPRPKVDGAILRISRIRTNLPRIGTNLFFRIVKAGFSHPRKQILNNLSKVLKLDKEKTTKWLKESDINYKQRAETLTIKDWIKLTGKKPK